MCLVYRIGQKRILKNAIDHVTASYHHYGAQISSKLPKGKRDMIPSGLKEYNEWMLHNFQSKVEIFQFGETLGWFASQDISQDISIMDIPEGFLINVETIKEHAYGKQLSQISYFQEDQILLAFLIHEKSNPLSLWRPFFAALQLESPILFPESLQNELMDTYVYEQMMGILDGEEEETGEMFHLLKKHKLFDPKVFNQENYLWAKVLLESRGVQVESHGKYLLSVLPLAVLPNQRTDTKLEKIGSYKRTLIKSLLPYSKGSEIYDFWLNDPQDLFLFSGKLLEDVTVDSIPLALVLTSEDPQALLKENYLVQNGLQLEAFINMTPPEKLLNTMRIYNAAKREFSELLKKGTLSLSDIRLNLTRSSERRVLESLRDLLKDQINGVKGSIQENLKISEMDKEPRKRSIAAYRARQKMIQEYNLNYILSLITDFNKV